MNMSGSMCENRYAILIRSSQSNLPCSYIFRWNLVSNGFTLMSVLYTVKVTSIASSTFSVRLIAICSLYLLLIYWVGGWGLGILMDRALNLWSWYMYLSLPGFEHPWSLVVGGYSQSFNYLLTQYYHWQFAFAWDLLICLQSVLISIKREMK